MSPPEAPPDSEASLAEYLSRPTADTVSCDLLAEGPLASVPEAPNVVYLVGMKFGSTSDAGLTWATNTFLAGMVAERFKHSRIVALSTVMCTRWSTSGAVESGSARADHY